MIVGSGVRMGGGPMRIMFGAGIHTVARERWSTSGALRNQQYGDAAIAGVTDRNGLPSGYRHPATWSLPQKAGGLASRGEIAGGGALNNANLAAGFNLEATLDGVGTISNAALGLVVSAVATLSGSGALTGDIVGVIQGAATLAGSGDLTGALGALAGLQATASGSGSLAATLTALGNMSADILPYTELSPESLAQAILDAADAIETGLTPRQALRLITAAVAGKSQANGTEYRAAVADHKVRIDATVDGSGNRTSITYDTDD